MTSHCTWGSVTTLHDVEGCVGTGPLSFGLSQFHGRGSWLVCEVGLSQRAEIRWVQGGNRKEPWEVRKWSHTFWLGLLSLAWPSSYGGRRPRALGRGSSRWVGVLRLPRDEIAVFCHIAPHGLAWQRPPKAPILFSWQLHRRVRETFELNRLKSAPSQLLPVFSGFHRLQTCCH